MLYEHEDLEFEVLSVDNIRWNGGKFDIAPRPHSALTYRVKGSADFSANGREVTAEENDILFLPQDLPYIADYTDGEIIVIHLVINDNKFTDIENYTVGHKHALLNMFTDALRYYTAQKPGHLNLIKARVYEILGTLAENALSANQPDVLKTAVTIINAEFKDSKLSVPDICRRAGISETQFRRLFKQYYAKTPIEYITDLRLNSARTMLASGCSVTDAAAANGFCDPKYFSRATKKHFNCTPQSLKTHGR